jgi:hypothetical protein
MQTHVTSTADASRAPESAPSAVQSLTIPGAAATPLEQARQMADNSPQTMQLKQYAAQMSAAGKGTVQRAYELCKPHQVRPIGNDHRARTVRADNIKGDTLGAAANSPSVAPFGWNELKQAGHTLANTSGNNSHYNAVRAHLMNGRLGGPGDKDWNLAPAPAQINSQMSAGPETSAKNLVDGGNTIWIETTVGYHSSSTTATDFTAAVPNRIDMRWGVQSDKTGQSWGADIELPVAPLSATEAQEYIDWPDGSGNDLVLALATKSNQVRAQAFDLVQYAALKLAILKAYPQVYLSMQDTAKGQILYALAQDQRLPFLKDAGVYTSPDELIAEGVIPLALAGHPIEAQAMFASLSTGGQRQTIISWKNSLLAHLGAIGQQWSIDDYTIFRYNSSRRRARILNSLDADQLRYFLHPRTKRERYEILDNWWQGLKREHTTPVAAHIFVSRVPPAMLDNFLERRKAQAKARRFLQSRPSRAHPYPRRF